LATDRSIDASLSLLIADLLQLVRGLKAFPPGGCACLDRWHRKTAYGHWLAAQLGM
jgi:hypothetical protein